jgi:hypothetical protein
LSDNTNHYCVTLTSSVAISPTGKVEKNYKYENGYIISVLHYACSFYNCYQIFDFKGVLVSQNNIEENAKKFREFSSDIKGLLAVEYVVLLYEARVK